MKFLEQEHNNEVTAVWNSSTGHVFQHVISAACDRSVPPGRDNGNWQCTVLRLYQSHTQAEVTKSWRPKTHLCFPDHVLFSNYPYGYAITFYLCGTTAFNTPTLKFALHYILRKCHPACKITARFSVNVLTVEILREKSIMTWTGQTWSTITSNRWDHTNTAMNLPASQEVQQVRCTPLCISNTKPKVPFHSAHATFISKQILFFLSLSLHRAFRRVI